MHWFNTLPSAMKVHPHTPPGLGHKGCIGWKAERGRDKATRHWQHFISSVFLCSLVVRSTMKADLLERLPNIHPIPMHCMQVYQLSAMALNEASQKGNRNVIERILKDQLGLSEDKACFVIINQRRFAEHCHRCRLDGVASFTATSSHAPAIVSSPR